MQDTLRRQKEQMKEDEKWLEKEERLLVGNRASLAFVNPFTVSPKFNVALEASLNEASFNNLKPPSRSRRPASLNLNVPLITVPKRGSMCVLYKMNLPVLLQDPMGPEDPASPLVRVYL